MKTAENSDGIVIAVHAWDAQSRRVLHTVTDGMNNVDLRFFYKHGALIEETNASGTLVKQHVFGGMGERFETLSSTETLYLFEKIDSSIASYANSSKIVKSYYDYKAQGLARLVAPNIDSTYFTSDDTYSSLNANNANDYLWQGVRIDFETGHYYGTAGTRMFDPVNGRKLQPSYNMWESSWWGLRYNFKEVSSVQKNYWGIPPKTGAFNTRNLRVATHTINYHYELNGYDELGEYTTDQCPELKIKVRLNFLKKSALSKFKEGVRRTWDSKFVLCCTNSKGKERKYGSTVRVSLVDSPNSKHKISYNPKRMTNQKNWGTNNNKPAERTAAHETDHYLGNKEEYGFYFRKTKKSTKGAKNYDLSGTGIPGSRVNGRGPTKAWGVLRDASRNGVMGPGTNTTAHKHHFEHVISTIEKEKGWGKNATLEKLVRVASDTNMRLSPEC